MIVEIIDKRKKLYYKVVNGSMALFTIIWSLISIGVFISGISDFTVLDSIIGFLVLCSAIPFISGIVGAIALYFKEKKFVELDESNKVTLILNMSEYDYKIDKFRLLPYSGNFLKLENLGSKFEISAHKVKDIIELCKSDKLIIAFQMQNNSVFEKSPKNLFDQAMAALWAMS